MTLPQNWQKRTLKEVVTFNPRHDRGLSDDLDVSFVPMPRVSERSRHLLPHESRKLGDVKRGYTHFHDDDVLFAKITPCMENGKAAIASNLTNGLGCGTTELHVLRPSDSVLPEWLYYYVWQERFRKDAERNMTGSAGQLRVPLSFLEEQTIPVPDSIDEQRRIAKKLDHIAAHLDDTRARLETIPAILKRFRMSVLAAACSGRLTADWRMGSQPVPGAKDVFDAIKLRRMEEARTPKQRADIEKCFAYPEEGDSELLPMTWRFVALDKLATFDYGTSAKSQKAGLVPVLRMGNVQEGEIDWSDLVFTSETAEITKYSLQRNTVLFNRTNSPELVGKTAIYRGERPAIFAGYLIRINTEAELLPEYLNYCLNSPSARTWCAQVKTDGVSQSNINAQKLGKFEIPLCSIEEQAEIVRRTNAMFKQAGAIETRYDKAKTFTDKLMPAVLAKAFRGELAE